MIIRQLFESQIPNIADREFTVDNHTYYTDIDDDGDVRKLWHYLELPNGDVVEPDFTPYERMDVDTVRAFIEQGYPKRKGPGPLRKSDFITSESRETTKTQLVAADIGRILMDKGAKTNDMKLSVLLSRLGDELTRFGEPFAAKNTTDLAKAVGINVAQINKLIKYGQAILNRDGPIDPRTLGGKSDLDEAWAGDADIKSTGKWAGKTIAELQKRRNALKKKEKRTSAESTELRQINFAIRSKKDWKGKVAEEMSTTPHDDVEVKNPKTGMTQTVSKDKAKQLIRKGYQVVGVHHNESITEAQFNEAAGEKDACYHKVKSRYKVWPSAYASGALVKCRKVGAANWGNKSKK
jgi:hypothetical protein